MCAALLRYCVLQKQEITSRSLLITLLLHLNTFLLICRNPPDWDTAQGLEGRTVTQHPCPSASAGVVFMCVSQRQHWVVSHTPWQGSNAWPQRNANIARLTDSAANLLTTCIWLTGCVIDSTASCPSAVGWWEQLASLQTEGSETFFWWISSGSLRNADPPPPTPPPESGTDEVFATFLVYYRIPDSQYSTLIHQKAKHFTLPTIQI